MVDHAIAPRPRFYSPQSHNPATASAHVAQPQPTHARGPEFAAEQIQRFYEPVGGTQMPQYPVSTLAGLPAPAHRSSLSSEMLPAYHALQTFQPQVQQPMAVAETRGVHDTRAPHADASTLGAYNHALERVRRDINNTMTPTQRRLGRTLTVIGSVAALGGGVTAGLLGLGALGAAASAVGLPVGAVAGIAAAAVFVGGTAIAVTTGALARSLVRKSLQRDPALQDKLAAVRTIRDQLAARSKLSVGEKKLLRNANRILGKVDGFGSHMKSQLKVAGKSQGIAALSTVFLAMLPFAAFGGGGLGSGGSFFGSGSSDSMFDATGSALGGDPSHNVYVQNGARLLDTMTTRTRA